MKKYLLLVALSILSQLDALKAQTLFNAPDTVCIRQPITLTSNNLNETSYYWGFCSGDLVQAPTGVNMGAGFNLHQPGNIDIIKDKDGQYYGFEVNTSTDEFLRLNFGNNLNNVPTVTNFGNLTNGLPHHPTSLFITFDNADSKWHIFVSGGYNPTESTLGRIDFGTSLSNPTPNIANFGNLGGVFDGPKGIFIAKDPADNMWYGYMVNRITNDLIRLDFAYNISNTPFAQSLGNPGGLLSEPTDMAGILDGGKWYFFVANIATNSIIRVDLGTTLNTLAPTATDLGDFLFRILVPSSISLTRDCGNIYAYITDSTTSQLISIQMPTAIGPYTGIDYSIVGAMNFPSSISSIIRDHDNLYAFATNNYDSTLSKVMLRQCNSSTIPSFTESTPPVYIYTDTGLFNVYYIINDGLPTMQVECKEIRVLPTPTIFMNNDTTMCQGDTIKLYAISNYADSFAWYTNYNINAAYDHTDSVKVWPAYSTGYGIKIFYPDGCIVDTVIHVHVSEVRADAGPDRTIADGAVTTLGGPGTSLNGSYNYHWTPYQYVNDTTLAFPNVNPPADYTYYLEVTEYNDQYRCQAHDTVVVHVNCGDFYLPNAFAPGTESPGANKFGILNKQISQLNYFRIFDRWGNLVFETSNPADQWDGTYNGSPAPVGVYVWIADGFCNGGKPINKKGNVTLLR